MTKEQIERVRRLRVSRNDLFPDDLHKRRWRRDAHPRRVCRLTRYTMTITYQTDLERKLTADIEVYKKLLVRTMVETN